MTAKAARALIRQHVPCPSVDDLRLDWVLTDGGYGCPRTKKDCKCPMGMMPDAEFPAPAVLSSASQLAQEHLSVEEFREFIRTWDKFTDVEAAINWCWKESLE